MIKLIFCLRRRAELTAAQFQRYWLEEHAALVRRHAKTLRIRRYIQCHAMDAGDAQPALSARMSKAEGFDGVAELWWDNREDMIAAGAGPDGREAGRLLLADERSFIDLEASVILLTEEHLILPAQPAP